MENTYFEIIDSLRSTGKALEKGFFTRADLVSVMHQLGPDGFRALRSLMQVIEEEGRRDSWPGADLSSCGDPYDVEDEAAALRWEKSEDDSGLS